MNLSDVSKDLLLKTASGDMPAFAEIYKISARFVYSVTLRILGSREEAQETTQEVFLKVHRSLRDFKFRSSFKTWLYRIAVNAALNSRKKMQADRARQIRYNENQLAGEVNAVETLDNGLDQNRQTEKINELLSGLGEEQRVCLVLREMQGLSYQEIAQTLNININTVRSRLKRARESLLKQGGYK